MDSFEHALRSRVCLELDLLLERIRESSRSSVRDRFPHINFLRGVTSMTQIASHEWPGVLLSYLIAIQTSQGRRLLHSQLEDDNQKYKNKLSKEKKQASFMKHRQKVLKPQFVK
jgi:hypothetical protein